MGGKKQTIGYRYFFSIHMGIGRGPVNEIAEVRAGDLTALAEDIDISTSGQIAVINKPDLFGGEKKEGGIKGPIYFYNGARDQELQPAISTAVGVLPSIAAQLGGDVPSFRGVVTAWFDGMICAMNPYPKEWSFRVRRSTAGWYDDDCWYPAKAAIAMSTERVVGRDEAASKSKSAIWGGIFSAILNQMVTTGQSAVVTQIPGEIVGMNGAHILYEANTNPEWGRGMPRDMIDENSYIAAANQLCAEKFGLCIPWFRQETVKEFIGVVINHIGGVQYLDRETGKMTLRLIRGDYDPDDLPLFTPETGLLDILEEDASGEETSYNEIIVKGFDPVNKQDISIRVQNLASIQNQEEIISNTIEYRGLATKELCARVAARELKVQLPLKKLTVVLDRRGWRIAPGMPFRISYPERGIENMILRAGECVDGTLIDGKINIKAVQDIFGMPDTAYVQPPSGGWTPPSLLAMPSPGTRLYEMSWRDFFLRSDASQQSTIDAGASFIAELAKEPTGGSTVGYDLATSLDGATYTTHDLTIGFTAWAELESDILPLDETLTLAMTNRARFADEFVAGMVALLDDEQMQFVTFDETTGVVTLKRAVADTIPAAHTAGTTVWLLDDDMGSDEQEYQDGETVYAKVLTRTTTDMLDPAYAVADSIVVDQRVFRPYPAGNLQIDGVSIYTATGEFPEPTFTWAHRDRILQQDFAIGHTESSVGPEPGTTYTFRLYANDGTTLLRTEDVGATDTWQYDSVMQVADGSPDSVWVEMESVRDEIISMYHYRFLVILVPLRITEATEQRETENSSPRAMEE